jgi:hypothetical protein
MLHARQTLLRYSKAPHQQAKRRYAMPYQAIQSALSLARSLRPCNGTSMVQLQVRRMQPNMQAKQYNASPADLLAGLQVHTSVLVCVQTSSIHHARQTMLR